MRNTNKFLSTGNFATFSLLGFLMITLSVQNNGLAAQLPSVPTTGYVDAAIETRIKTDVVVVDTTGGTANTISDISVNPDTQVMTITKGVVDPLADDSVTINHLTDETINELSTDIATPLDTTGNVVSNITQNSAGDLVIEKENVKIPVGNANSSTYAVIWVE